MLKSTLYCDNCLLFGEEGPFSLDYKCEVRAKICDTEFGFKSLRHALIAGQYSYLYKTNKPEYDKILKLDHTNLKDYRIDLENENLFQLLVWANTAKFVTNNDLQKYLLTFPSACVIGYAHNCTTLGTGKTTLSGSAFNTLKWPGKNLLGQSITQFKLNYKL